MQVSTQAHHSTSTQVGQHVTQGYFTGADAGAVASWYQSSRGYGAVFASFSSGRPVEQGDLVDAIVTELRDAIEPADVLALEHFRLWVLSR